MRVRLMNLNSTWFLDFLTLSAKFISTYRGNCIALAIVVKSLAVTVAMKVLLVILLFSLSRISGEDNGNCKCGAFRMEVAADEEGPIVTRVASEVTCDAAGQIACSNMCFIMAKSEKEKGPKLVCSALKTTIKGLKPAIFAKVCDGKWIYTGLTSSSAMCCDSGKPSPCS